MNMVFWLVHHGVFAFGCGLIAGFVLGQQRWSARTALWCHRERVTAADRLWGERCRDFGVPPRDVTSKKD
jgi:hypothetical protein